MSFKDNEIIKNNQGNIVIEKLRKINEYTMNLVEVDNSRLTEIYEREKSKEKLSPIIEPEIGRFLSFYIRSKNSRQVLELGSGPGYSTIWLGEALRSTGGFLTSIEIDQERFEQAKKNVQAAGLSAIVEIKLENALRFLEDSRSRPSLYDLVFIDLDKTLYPEVIDICIEITSKKGIIIADDTLFKPKGLRNKVSDPVDKYNKKVFSDSRLYSTILPVGDGLTLSLKL